MRTTITAAIAGTLGVIVGATGWALLGPEKTVTADAKPAATSPAPTAPTAPEGAGHHFKTAQDLADALDHAGFTVSMLHKDTEAAYVSDVGGSAYDFTVTDKAGKPAPGDAGINWFPNAPALTEWSGVSQTMGGIAVTGDTWAVSLPTTTDTARADSKRLAPKIAHVLGGKVVR
ncbi:hypothetical protein IF655_05730 [Streptomyces sp. DSM 110735]|uniref:hypothetical protein n=1 Tax=Streptomyces sp. DSM 110735 TaxID=2775031 RepID=UPI0018F42BEE|nr:hypothetical protein [Streptomyces sp. DSM 110735]MBJ7902795.1 hypothetical protein [Streptomyces sp. DSM 110735]